MAIELERYLREQLGSEGLPKGHPDRKILEGQLAVVEAYNSRAREGLPTAEELVAFERKAWHNLFGKEVGVPTPPALLFETLRVARKEGFSSFEPHFLPGVALKENGKYPGWKSKPEPWFWQQISSGLLVKDAAILPGAWVLVDSTPKPNYDEGKQLYENDPLAPILARGRREGKIAVPSFVRHVPETSRFAVSADEVEQYVAPEVAKLLGVDGNAGVIVRKPREIEFNVLGNNFYPQFGQTNTAEWFEDRFADGDRSLGGRSGLGGLAYVDWYSSGHRRDRLAFRLLVEFPSKS